MRNVLSFDLEEWDQLAYRRVTGKYPPPSDSLCRQIEALLAILDAAAVKATFFVLGRTAERHPDIVRQLAKLGHEIACHGYDHLIVDRISREEFRADTTRAKRILEDITGLPVTGYRAAEFSIRNGSLWALEELAELGFRYDSSIFPIRHRRYGIAGFARVPSCYDLSGGFTIVEVSPSAIRMAGTTLPMAGGGYFRLLPTGAILRAIRALHAEKLPMVTYFHPYEFDPERLRVFAAAPPPGWKSRLRGRFFDLHQNLRRGTMPAKLTAMLKQFSFVTCSEYLKEARLGERRELFSTAG